MCTVSTSYAACIHDTKLSGADITSFEGSIHIKSGDTYLPPTMLNLEEQKIYDVQISHPSSQGKTIEYYTNAHLESYLGQMQTPIESYDYELQVIGHSIEGRDIPAIYPKVIDPNKQTIIMTGRQHGDESTANWIIEGFLDEVFVSAQSHNWHERFQLVIYPIVNPDGAHANSRYNANRRDLNRSWKHDPAQSRDEVQIIHQHLDQLRLPMQNVVAFLDMHGSYWTLNGGDFIYHVDSRFRDLSFYNLQKAFIDELAVNDQWNGRSNISNGDPGMIRIIMVKNGINALTHETPRDIPENNREGRSVETLKSQGHALFQTIVNLY